MEIAAFFGRLAGSALNPVVWGAVIAALYLTRNWPAFGRVATAVVATVAAGAVIYAFTDQLTVAEATRGLLFAALVAFLIASAWVAIRRTVR